MFPALGRSLRIWLRSPGHALVLVLTLALGVGANVAVFSVVRAALLERLPVSDEERLVGIVLSRRDGGGHYAVPHHTFAAWRDEVDGFTGVAAARERVFRHAGDGGVERLVGSEVSVDFFRVVGSEAALGRTFDPSIDRAPDRVVVLSDALWRSRFGADEGILGGVVELDGESWAVIGVMPPAPRDDRLEWLDLWVPLDVDEERARIEPLWGFNVLARLAPGVSLEAASSELDLLGRRLEERYPVFNRGWTAEARPVREWVAAESRTALLLVWLAVALVLAIACVNLSNLLLSRALARREEMAVRRALGAGRARLALQLLAELLWPALLGAAAGLGLAVLLLEAAAGLGAAHLPRFEAASLDLRIGVFTMLVAALALALAGLLPALRAASTNGAPGQRSTGEGRPGRRLRFALVVAQAALATAVVVSSMLLLRSWQELGQVDFGWTAEGLLTLELELPPERAADKTERIALFRELIERIEALPGVSEAALSGIRLPLRSGQGTFAVWVEGQPRGETPEIVVVAQTVSDRYFECMGIEVVAGRGFLPEDSWESSRAVVVNRSFARRYLGGEPIGRWLEWPNGDRGTVVGVVADVRQVAIDAEPAPEVYLPWGVAPARQALVARVAGDPATLLAPIRDRIASLAPGTLVWNAATGPRLVRESLGRRRFTTALFAFFALLSLALGVSGTHALASHSAARRRRELAIRLACGARPGDLRSLLLRDGLLPVAGGVLLGIGLGAAGARALASQLFGVGALDLPSYLVAAMLLLASAALAGLLPARRAHRVDAATLLADD